MPPGVGILVRLSDKIKRLQELIDGQPMQIAEPLDDTFRDMIGYAILYMARPDETRQSTPPMRVIDKAEITSVSEDGISAVVKESHRAMSRKWLAEYIKEQAHPEETIGEFADSLGNRPDTVYIRDAIYQLFFMPCFKGELKYTLNAWEFSDKLLEANLPSKERNVDDDDGSERKPVEFVD